MNTIVSAVKAFVDDEGGVTLIEYGLLAALIAAAIGALVLTLKGGLTDAFGDIATKLSGAIT